MELDKKERLILSNQLKILEKLYPDEADYYAQHRKALEEGYALHYSWLFENIYDEMSVEECKEVLDFLDMYRAITFSYQKLEDKGELESHSYLKFSGFDGNNETKQMAYAQYFMIDLDRYQELRYDQPSPDLNSHMQMLPKYRNMLKKWKNCKDKNYLSKDDIELILSAKG